MQKKDNFNALWLQLMQKLNPDFVKNNGELIGQFVKAIQENSNAQTDENLVNLDEFGIDDPNDLAEIVEMVPRYNDLIEDYEQLEQENADLKAELDQMKNELAKVEHTINRAKKYIDNLKGDRHKMLSKIQSLKVENKAKDHLISKINFANSSISGN